MVCDTAQVKAVFPMALPSVGGRNRMSEVSVGKEEVTAWACLFAGWEHVMWTGPCVYSVNVKFEGEVGVQAVGFIHLLTHSGTHTICEAFYKHAKLVVVSNSSV